MEKVFEYDVAFSYAHEQYTYVQRVANVLKINGIKVFFDKDEEVDIWGKNLIDHLHHIYAEKAQFCVIFVSTEYANKVWTNFERQIIQARNLVETGVLLPAKFDDINIQGLAPSIAYILLKGLSPNEFAEIIIKKISKTNSAPRTVLQSNLTKPRLNKPIQPYKVRSEWIEFITSEIKNAIDREDGFECYVEDIDGSRQIHILYGSNPVYTLSIFKNAFGITDDGGISFAGSLHSTHSTGVNALGIFAWSKEKNAEIVKLNDFSLLSTLGMSSKDEYTKEEFVEALWAVIVKIIEREY